jgi:hypothetical protein
MHASCPHNIGGGVHPFPRQNRAVATLCTCSCHGTCPIGSQREISNEEWLRECTCSGSNALRENLNQMKETADARRSQREEVFRDINFAHGKSAAQIQREILAAYDAKGYAAPTDFSRISRFAAANTARRGTRTARLLIEVVGSLHAVRRWAERNISDNDHPENEAELGRMRRSAGALTALAASAALGAYFTRGFIRLGLVVIATLLAVLAAWVGLWASAVGLITPHHRSRDDPTSHISTWPEE